MWVSNGTSQGRREGGEGFDSEGVYSNQNDVSRTVTPGRNWFWQLHLQEISPEGREAVSLIANIIKVLAGEGIPLTETLIGESYAWAEKNVTSGSGPFDSETEKKMLNEIVGLEFPEIAWELRSTFFS